MSLAAASSASSSEETCAICLDPIDNMAKVACAHAFCFECINSWAHTTNSCPLCKVPFRMITQRVHGGRTRKIRVQERKQVAEWSSEEMDRFLEDLDRFLESSRSSDDSNASIGIGDCPDDYETGSFVTDDNEPIELKSDSSVEIVPPPPPRRSAPSRRRRRKRRRTSADSSSSSWRSSSSSLSSNDEAQ